MIKHWKNIKTAKAVSETLCDIYSEAGKDMLCKTCKRYPRHMEEFENLREVSLSLSCPEVARIILGRKKETKFLTSYKETKEEEYSLENLLYCIWN